MIRAILFDLDGTLFSVNQAEFMHNYIGLISPRFAHLIPSARFAKQLLRSMNTMIKEPKPDRTNLQTFYEDFSKATGLTYNILWPIFEEFHAIDFPSLQCMVRAKKEGKRAVEVALQQGYITALASNPVLPMTTVVERIRWAELSEERFAVIPSIEDFHFCKPHLGFYKEIARRLKLDPTECLVVGNHPVEDMVARELGFKTFLITKSSDKTLSDYSGELADLSQLILTGNL
ncbi:Hydrolase [Candidatus Desulfosporosinus infrequens]|uniref:Hydrolase n=1 Tax=Candidatus Desulfosporosinus infrequens TaxID=2043169 RepID=A0A2U3LRW1_9FIRM|nr:Hydrolase [Candidatus Desulfosporosinus infrequens]